MDDQTAVPPATLPSGVDPNKVMIVTSVLSTLIPLIPGLGPWISGLFGENPHLLMSVVGAIFGALHFAQTKGWVK